MVYWKEEDGCIFSDFKENGMCKKPDIPVCKFIIGGAKPNSNTASGGVNFINHFIYFALKTRIFAICLRERGGIYLKGLTTQKSLTFSRLTGSGIDPTGIPNEIKWVTGAKEPCNSMTVKVSHPHPRFIEFNLKHYLLFVFRPLKLGQAV